MPPLKDSRDAFKKRFHGYGRRELFEQFGPKLLRIYLAYSYEKPTVIEAAHEVRRTLSELSWLLG